MEIIDWPVSKSIEGVLGVMRENNLLDSTYVKGLLPKLMKPLDNPVIFAYRNIFTGKLEFTDIFREEPLRTLKNMLPGLCFFMRKEYEMEDMDWYSQICVHNDSKSSNYLFSLYDTKLDVKPHVPNGWEKITEYEGIPLFKYTCEETCFIELIAPLLVNFKNGDNNENKIIGAFISGQYIDEEKNYNFSETYCSVIRTYTRLAKLSDIKKKDLEEKLREQFALNKKLPSNQNMVEFLKIICDFSKILQSRYSDLLHSHSMKLQQAVDEVIWEEGSNLHQRKDVPSIEKRFENLNGRLIKGLKKLVNEDLAGFTRIHISMPKHNLEQFEHSKNLSEYEAFNNIWIDKENHSNKWVPKIDLNSTYWKEIINAEKNDICLKSMTISSCNNDERLFLYELEKLFPNITKYSMKNNIRSSSYGCYVFATQRHRNYPIIFLIVDANHKRICDKQIIKEVFESAAEKYLAQWNEIFSDYQRFLIEVSAGYIDHELGQIQSGIESLAKEAMDSYNPIVEWTKLHDVPKEFQSAIYKTKDFAKDILTFSKLTELISKHQLTSIFSTEPICSEFMPYGDILYELDAIYKSQCEREGKRVLISSLENVRSNPRYSLPMYEDKNIFLIIVNNLIRNAVKYSWPGTYIKIVCWYDEISKKRIIDIVNYGRFMSADDRSKIFEFRTRGNNASDASGMGIGLYLVKHLVENVLLGTVVLQHSRISEMCVPAFQYFTREAETYLAQNQYESYYKELKRLQTSNIYNKVVNGPFNELTKREALAMIDTPTDEFRFIVQLPHKEKEK